MDTNTNTNPMPISSNMPQKSTPILLIVIAVAVLSLIIWWVNRAPVMEQAVIPTASPTPQDELQLEAELIDLGDVDSEFDQIDQDLNSL